MARKIAFYLPAAGWLIISIVLLTLPGSAFPKENWLDKIWADKWIHIGMFGLLVILWCRALFKTSTQQLAFAKFFIIIAILGVVYGAGMEFVQKYLVVNRSFDTGDIIADTIGCLIGLLFSMRSYTKK